MPHKKSPQAWISTRTLLVCAVLFSVVAIGLSEVQRRSLVYRIERLIIRQEEAHKIDSTRLSDLQSSVGALQVLINNGQFSSRKELRAAIAKRLIDGKTVVLRFDDSDRENRDASGAILCNSEAESGYLGVFVAGDQYKVSYDRVTQQWTGSGPLQTRSRSKESTSCPHITSIYGPRELGQAVDPANGLILWGAFFNLDGLDVLLDGQRVGRVVWVD